MSSRKLKKKQTGYIKFKELAKSLKASAISMLGKLKHHLNKRNITIDYFVPFFDMNNFLNMSKKSAMIIGFGVDKSCIGAHNINISNKIKKLYEELRLVGLMNIKMYGIGKFMKYYIKLNYKSYYIGNVLNVDKELFSFTLSSIILESILKIECDIYYLVFNKYVDIFEQKTCYYKVPGFNNFFLYFLNSKNIISNKREEYFNFFYKRSLPLFMLLKQFYNFTFSLFILDSLEENNLSGIGSRISCMDNCITNAEKKIEEVTLLYNKARQNEITNELVAIITAAQAIMDNELLNNKFINKLINNCDYDYGFFNKVKSTNNNK